jgi:cytoskeletal protein RodZ
VARPIDDSEARYGRFGRHLMKSTYLALGAFVALLSGSTVAEAQTAPRVPTAPTEAGVISPRPARTDNSAAADSNQTDASRVDQGTDPETPTASHDDATGQSTPTPSTVKAPNAVVSHPDFKTLDVNSRGYLTADDVAHNRWLATNFSRCDANHDGRLSQQEFANCK